MAKTGLLRPKSKSTYKNWLKKSMYTYGGDGAVDAFNVNCAEEPFRQ